MVCSSSQLTTQANLLSFYSLLLTLSWCATYWDKWKTQLNIEMVLNINLKVNEFIKKVGWRQESFFLGRQRCEDEPKPRWIVEM